MRLYTSGAGCWGFCCQCYICIITNNLNFLLPLLSPLKDRYVFLMVEYLTRLGSRVRDLGRDFLIFPFFFVTQYFFCLNLSLKFRGFLYEEFLFYLFRAIKAIESFGFFLLSFIPSHEVNWFHDTIWFILGHNKIVHEKWQVRTGR